MELLRGWGVGGMCLLGAGRGKMRCGLLGRRGRRRSFGGEGSGVLRGWWCLLWRRSWGGRTWLVLVGVGLHFHWGYGMLMKWGVNSRTIGYLL